MSHVAHMDVSCRKYKWVMSHMKLRHVAHMNVSCHTYMCVLRYFSEGSRAAYESVMSHIWMEHVAHIFLSHVTRHTCVLVYFDERSRAAHEWAVLHKCMKHVARSNNSCRTYEWVMSYIYMCVLRYFGERSRVVYKWVMSHIWMKHVAHMNQSCCKYKWVTSHIYMCVLWREVMCSALTSHVTHMDKSCRKYECVVSCIHMCVLSDFGVKSRAVYEWAISHIWMSHVIHMYACALVLCREVTCSIWMRYVARVNESCHTFVCVCSGILERGHGQAVPDASPSGAVMCVTLLVLYLSATVFQKQCSCLYCWYCDVCHAPGTLHGCN